MNLFGQIKIGVLLLFLCLIVACAKIASPTGGPRDRRPPVVMGTLPEMYSTNFKGKRILITFDEYVTLDNINENLIISPPLQSRPKVWLKGRSVVVDLQEDLKEDHTYTFNFQNAIKDLNEGNVLEGCVFVVSTGPTLDSLSVTGNVYYAENLETPEKVFVLMHRNLADTAVRKSLPDYIGVIDKFGYFRINNISPGSYKLYALKDADNNKRYSSDNEEFAFAGQVIEVSADNSWIPVVEDDTTAVAEPLPEGAAISQNGQTGIADTIVPIGENQLFMFKKASEARYLMSPQRKLKNQLEFAIPLPPESMPFEFSIPGAGEGSFIIERSVKKDTLIVWLTDSTLIDENPLRGEITYPFTDSSNVIISKTDTVNLRYVEPGSPRRGAVEQKRVALVIRNNFSASGGAKPGQKFIFSSGTPLIEPNIAQMKLFDITKDTTQVPFSLQKDSLTATKYFLETKILPEKKYLFVADSGAFRDVYDSCSDSIGIIISLKSIESYGNLSFNIKNTEGPLIVQLLDNTEKLIMETRMYGDGKAEFPLLDPTTYRARIIFDADNNGIWTSGDFDKERQPEQVTYYENEIEVKANFDIGQDWDAGKRNEKNPELRATKK